MNAKIIKHGSEYRESSIEDKYSFCVCPECFSQEARIIPKDEDVDDVILDRETGTCFYQTSGLFMKKYICVNYVCKKCGCMFTMNYAEPESHRRLNPDVPSWIIMVIILLFSAFSAYCASTGMDFTANHNGNHNDIGIVLWFAVSITAFLFLSCIVASAIVCFIKDLIKKARNPDGQ